MTEGNPFQSGETNADHSAPASNLLLRVVSAVLLAPLALATAYFGGWPFALFWTVASVAVVWEWLAVAAGAGHKFIFAGCGGLMVAAALLLQWHEPIAAIAFVALGALMVAIFAPSGRRMWIASGSAYAGIMLTAPMMLRADESLGMAALMLLFAVVWTTDIVAYFAGRTFGGPKLCSTISPKKTWSGAIAGTLGSMIVAVVIMRLFGSFNGLVLALLGLVLSVFSQLGDLLESAFKRHFGVKDASHLIPGHGGVMDRLDGFWAAALVACVVGLLRGGFDGAAQGLLVW